MDNKIFGEIAHKKKFIYLMIPDIRAENHKHAF